MWSWNGKLQKYMSNVCWLCCSFYYMPQFAKRLKVHLILHLVDCIQDFGPASGFNTERYIVHNKYSYKLWTTTLNYTIQAIIIFFRFEAFNSLIRAQNIFGNRHALSKDISYNFAVLEHLRYLCSGGVYEKDNAVTRYVYKCWWCIGLIPVHCVYWSYTCTLCI